MAAVPRYRGMLPTFWQLLHGEKEIGITVHTMVEDIDGGEILRQVFTEVRDGETLSELIVRTKRMGAEAVLSTLEEVRDGSVDRRRASSALLTGRVPEKRMTPQRSAPQ